MLTTLQEEPEEQRLRWKLRATSKNNRWFDDLIVNEFRSPEDLKQIETEQLRMNLGHAVREVPYYRDLFKQQGLDVRDIHSADDLAKIPVLSKNQLCDHESELKAETLPIGHKRTGFRQSSGTTTGRPARVFGTQWSDMLWEVLKQRELRWYRFDPSQLTSGLRLNSLLPKPKNGIKQPPDYTYKFKEWPLVGKFFHTGPCVATSSERSIEEIVSWLQEYRPAYLLSNPGVLEQMAFYCGGGHKLDHLRGLFSIAAQLTSSMRERIETTFEVPVQQNYGLNEIGIVACRCQAGNYHVHSENCLVEIVDEEGQASPPGVPGHLLVTSLRNFFMPLLRYDTDDVAVKGTSPCACGRTLPYFEKIEGRYRRYAFLPKGTRQLVNAVADALMGAPPELTTDLRRYQVHQYEDGNFELRLLSEAPIQKTLEDWIGDRWKAAVEEEGLNLSIIRVDQVATSIGGKFLEFTSDFNPDDSEMAENS